MSQELLHKVSSFICTWLQLVLVELKDLLDLRVLVELKDLRVLKVLKEMLDPKE